MKKWIENFRNDESGAVVIAVAAFMVCALLLGALSVDFGCAYVKAAQVQTAADAAVLAAGRLLPVSAGDTAGKQKVLDTAKAYLRKNGVDNPDDYRISLGKLQGSRYECLHVAVDGSVPTSFAGVIGVHRLNFTREAEVQIAVCVRLNDVVPLSVEKTKLESCLAAGNKEHITLKFGASGNKELPSGDFGAIDLDGVRGGGANDYEARLAHGYKGEIAVGDDLYPVENGNMAGPTAASFNYRYNSCTHFPGAGGCTAEHFEAHCPRMIKVPVIEYVSKNNVKIVGFAAFVLEGLADTEKDTITGSYVDMVTIGSAGGDTTGTAADYGVYSLLLTK